MVSLPPYYFYVLANSFFSFPLPPPPCSCFFVPFFLLDGTIKTRIKSNTMTPVMADDDTTILLKHWKALIISIAIIYYFRLPSPPPSASPSLSPPSSPPTLSTYSISAWGKDRKTFEALVNTHLQVEGIGFSFDGLISTVLDNFYKATTVPGMPH